jgi:nicotinate phosphoribosyltransferase
MSAPRSDCLCPEDYSLLTDLYQLTMSACYIGEGVAQTPASFELFARSLPEHFGYLVAMGLSQALDYLEHLAFSEEQLQALRDTGIFDHAPEAFWEILANGQFEGDVWALPEGTVAFANEPLLRVEAPLWQAQWVETFLLNTLNYQTLIATRAARMRDVVGDAATLLEFGTRRAFSPQASVWAARAAIASGMNATSNVLAALRFGQKPSGTMAHALVMAFEAARGDEQAAFTAFQKYFPKAPLLIDTYDTVAAAATLAERIRTEGFPVTGVRLDSGDLVELSQKVRSLLPDVAIFASGDLDEFEIDRLQRAGACISGFGIGTKLVTGQPVNGVYKLVEMDGVPTMKVASNKVTYPGRKQVFRTFDADGTFGGDRLALANEAPTASETPLLQKVMQAGKRLWEAESLEAIAQRTRTAVQSLPAALRQVENPASLDLIVSEALQQLTEQTRTRVSPA